MQTLFAALAIAVWVVILGGWLCAIDGTDPRYIWDLLIGSRIRLWRQIRALERTEKAAQ